MMSSLCYTDGMSESSHGSQPQSPRFATTQWSLVVAAGRASSPDADDALATLCETYWYPLYAFARRRGQAAEDARDLVQEFFSRMLEKDYLQTADRERGRFRSFLLTVFKRFLSNERDRQLAQKRGGGKSLLSIDVQAGEDRYRFEPTDDWTPERIYERRWAITLLDRVMARLRQDYVDKEKGALFEQCKETLVGAHVDYEQARHSLGMAPAAVRVAAHRLRQRYRDMIESEVLQTLDDPGEIKDELNHLKSALRGGNS